MNRPSVFLSYSSKDAALKDEVLSHFGVLNSAGIIDIWTDDKIATGTDWLMEIENAVDRSAVAVLLITANFLTSRFILQQEVPNLLRRRQTDGLVIMPIFAKSCAYQQVDWLSAMQLRPHGRKPIWDRNSDVDEELTKITLEIANILDMLKNKQNVTQIDEDSIRIIIHAPDGVFYEAQISQDVIVGQIIDCFLDQWQFPVFERKNPVYFGLRFDADNAPQLDRSISLRSAGIETNARLRLDATPLRKQDTIGMMVRVVGRGDFNVGSYLHVTVEELAKDIVGETAQQGYLVVERIGGGAQPTRRLQLSRTLFDECVDDGARLRISHINHGHQGQGR